MRKINNDTITEDYVSFETAKLLKEKGFSGDIFAYYHILDKKIWSANTYVHSEFPHLYVPAPTLQIVMKWLREKYSLEIYPYHNNPTIYNSKWWFEIIEYPNSVAEYESGNDEEFDSYEQACETAIKYCLKHLLQQKH